MKESRYIKLQSGYEFHPSILRAYDIRGVYNETLHDEDAFYVGRSFASFLRSENKKKVVVGCDIRQSSPALKKNLIAGLVASGIEVIDVGVGPTPMLYFAVYNLNCDGGIMITGSHNPKNHNGFKIALKDRPFYGDDILNLAEITRNSDFIDATGSLEKMEIEEIYIKNLLSDCLLAQSESHLLDEIDQFTPKKRLKIAWDCGNGATGDVVKKISQRIAADHILLFEEMNGDFPNHHPDPTVPENLEDLKKAIFDEACDFGIAFDGDGDRIGVMDNKGEILWGDQLMIFFARDVLNSHPNAIIIADVKASDVLFSEITKAGGNAIMAKTGHSLIKAKMKETKALLAGEMSGHIFFADKYFGFDDALYAAIRLIDIIYNSTQTLAQMRESLPKTFNTPEIRIDCPDDKKFAVVEKIKESLNQQKIQFNDVDGVRASLEYGWWLIRASNTQPALVARCEANSKENLFKLKNNIKEQLNFCNIAIPKELC